MVQYIRSYREVLPSIGDTRERTEVVVGAQEWKRLSSPQPQTPSKVLGRLERGCGIHLLGNKLLHLVLWVIMPFTGISVWWPYLQLCLSEHWDRSGSEPFLKPWWNFRPSTQKYMCKKMFSSIKISVPFQEACAPYPKFMYRPADIKVLW